VTETPVTETTTVQAAAQAAAEPAIVVDSVSKRFRMFRDRPTNLKEKLTTRSRGGRSEDFWALRDVSLTIPRGSTYGLIGHNGSGKSTLLKLIAGIHRPTSGTITAHGRVSAMLELGAGFHPELSGRDNIYLNGSILGLGRKQISAAMDEIIEFSGIGEFVDVPVKVYSSGMYVRLGFSIAANWTPSC
jgi:ABC-type polysaccharide/polyol phosphate transport system ATPase subunit